MIKILQEAYFMESYGYQIKKKGLSQVRQEVKAYNKRYYKILKILFGMTAR